MTTIKTVHDSAQQFAKENNFTRGWLGGDENFWIKFSDFEPANQANVKYIFFIDGNKLTCYKA